MYSELKMSITPQNFFAPFSPNPSTLITNTKRLFIAQELELTVRATHLSHNKTM